MMQTFMTLAEVARELGAFETSRIAYSYLQDLHIPLSLYDRVSLGMITIEVRIDVSGS